MAICAVGGYLVSCGGSEVQVAPQTKGSTVLSLTAISPTVGPTSGGTSVTLQGTAFSDGVRVMFGSQVSTSVVVVSSTQIRAVTPAHSAGTVDVKVANSDLEKATLASAFDYTPAPTLDSVTPDSGLAAGGTKVTITGTNFASGSMILFGQSQAGEVVVVSDTVIQAITPPHSPGLVDVKIVTPDQLSFVMSRSFRFGQVLFADGFESGDFSAWSSAGKYSCSTYGSSFEVSSTRVHSGADAAEFRYVIPSDQCSSSQDNDVVAVRSFDSSNGYPNGLEHFFIRGYVNFKTPEAGGTQDNIQRKVFYIRDASTPNWHLILTSWGVAGRISLTIGRSYVGTSQLMFWNLGTLDYDQWYCVELEVVLNTPGLSDGKLSLWVDGEPTFQQDGMDIRGLYTTSARTFLVGMQANRTNFMPVDEYRYWDDVIIADAYVGP